MHESPPTLRISHDLASPSLRPQPCADPPSPGPLVDNRCPHNLKGLDRPYVDPQTVKARRGKSRTRLKEVCQAYCGSRDGRMHGAHHQRWWWCEQARKDLSELIHRLLRRRTEKVLGPSPTQGDVVDGSLKLEDRSTLQRRPGGCKSSLRRLASGVR